MLWHHIPMESSSSREPISFFARTFASYCGTGCRNQLLSALKDVSPQPELPAQRFYIDTTLIQWLVALANIIFEAFNEMCFCKNSGNWPRNPGKFFKSSSCWNSQLRLLIAHVALLPVVNQRYMIYLRPESAWNEKHDWGLPRWGWENLNVGKIQRSAKVHNWLWHVHVVSEHNL